jgi:hypothetical protein
LKLNIEQVPDEDAVIIEGTRYANSMFRIMGQQGIARGPFVIESRSDGTIHIRTILRWPENGASVDGITGQQGIARGPFVIGTLGTEDNGITGQQGIARGPFVIGTLGTQDNGPDPTVVSKQAQIDNAYTCESCGGVFERGQTEEQARLEQRANFPHAPDAEMALVCDDCYKDIMASIYGSSF